MQNRSKKQGLDTDLLSQINQNAAGTAHKLARIFYRLWTSGDAYADPGIDTYEQHYQERTLKNLKKKAQALGERTHPYF